MSQVTIDKIQLTLPEYLGGKDYSQVAILVDENTRKHCLPVISNILPEHKVVQIESGELNKNLESCQVIWDRLTTAAFDRKSLLINLGGGVIGDMGGFCAIAFKRGIDFINIPTTLLSMVDASVGGKLGIDFNGFKNHIGFFKEPNAVLIDPVFLETLPKRELRSGFAEVLKHGIIADEDYFQQIVQDGLDQTNWNAVIAHSVHIKSEVVEQDPRESGLRKILNFGHTIGHAIESRLLEAPKPLRHGEAIAIGMICEAFLSTKLCGLDKSVLDGISSTLLKIYGKVELKKKDFPLIIDKMYQDKKNTNNLLNHSLIKSIGSSVFDIAVDEKDVIDALFFYHQLKH